MAPSWAHVNAEVVAPFGPFRSWLSAFGCVELPATKPTGVSGPNPGIRAGSRCRRRNHEREEVVRVAVGVEIERRRRGVERGGDRREPVVRGRFRVADERRRHEAGGGGRRVGAAARIEDRDLIVAARVVDADEQVERAVEIRVEAHAEEIARSRRDSCPRPRRTRKAT